MNMNDQELMSTQGYYTFVQHPIYSDYGTNTLNEVHDLKKNRLIKQYRRANAYLRFSVRDSTYKRRRRKLHTHGFVYECHNGIITNNLVIDHINSNKADNRLENLHLVTTSENSKAAWDRDETVWILGRNKTRPVIAISSDRTRETYKSCDSCAKDLGLCAVYN